MAAFFADGIFTCIFIKENVRVSIEISLSFVPEVPFDNKSALLQVLAWRRTGAKLSIDTLLTMIYYAIWRHWSSEWVRGH